MSISVVAIIRQEGFDPYICKSERSFKYWLKIAEGRKKAFGRNFVIEKR